MVGSPDPGMLFPVDTFFVPYAVLQNISNHAVTAQLSITSDSVSGQTTTRLLDRIQLAAGRVGTIGQLASQTINGGRTVPWVWSVIEFNSSGTPTYSNVGMFPTYSVYVSGNLAATYPQSAVAAFVLNNQTYQLTPSQIP
jgi:hypothetical protein